MPRADFPEAVGPTMATGRMGDVCVVVVGGVMGFSCRSCAGLLLVWCGSNDIARVFKVCLVKSVFLC